MNKWKTENPPKKRAYYLIKYNDGEKGLTVNLDFWSNISRKWEWSCMSCEEVLGYSVLPEPFTQCADGWNIGTPPNETKLYLVTIKYSKKEYIRTAWWTGRDNKWDWFIITNIKDLNIVAWRNMPKPVEEVK